MGSNVFPELHDVETAESLRSIQARKRRHSVLHEDLDQKEDKKEFHIVLICEWIGLTLLIAALAYVEYVCLTAHHNKIFIIGISFQIGPNFQQFLFQQILLLDVFAVVNSLMMLSAKYSRLAFAIVGFHGVHSSTCVPLLLAKALMFTTIVSTSTGLSEFYPRGILSIISTTVHSLLSFAFTGQYLITSIFPTLQG